MTERASGAPAASGTPPRFEKALVRGALMVLLVLAALWLGAQLADVITAVVVALVLVGTLNPMCGALEARGLGRTASVLVVFGASLLALGLVGFLTVPALISQVRGLLEGAPLMQQHLVERLARSHVTLRLARLVASLKLGDLLPSGKQAFEYSSQVVNVVGWGMTTLALTFYLLADPATVQAALYAVVPRRYHLRLARITLNLETIVGGYMRGQLITSVLMSLFVYTLLRLGRIHNPLPLAIFAGITDVLPLIGGILGAAPLVAAALPHGTVLVVVVLASVVGYQEVENRLIIPRVYGRVLRLPAWAIILALLVGAKLMGIVGALLSLPVAAGLRMVLEELRVDLPGEASVDPAVRERDEEVEDLYAELTEGAGAQTAASIALDIADSVRKADARDPAAAAEVPVTGGGPPPGARRVPARSDGAVAAAHEVRQQADDGQQQQDVNQGRRHVEDAESRDPGERQNDGQSEQHEDLRSFLGEHLKS